jgi:hypothetical protein
MVEAAAQRYRATPASEDIGDKTFTMQTHARGQGL